jgi:hypothetical protein
MSGNTGKALMVAAGVATVALTAGAAAPLLSAGATAAKAATGLSGLQMLGLAGSGLSAFGQYQAGQEAEANASFNSKLQAINAQQNDRRAKVAALTAGNAAEAARRDTRRRVGSIKAGLAGAGVVTSEGSPLLIQAEQLAEGELGARNELFAGTLESQGFSQQASIARMKADSLRSKGSAAKRNSIISAGTTLLSGGSSVLR